MEHCQHCKREGERLEGMSQRAYVDYYRCPECGGVWTAPKEGSDNPAAEQDTTDFQNSLS